MKAQGDKVTKLVQVESTLPDGVYRGLWSGYVVEVEYENEKYYIHVNVGVKGINIKCTVKIEDNEILVEILKN